MQHCPHLQIRAHVRSQGIAECTRQVACGRWHAPTAHDIARWLHGQLLTTRASAGSGVKPVGMTRCVTAAAATVTGGVAGTARPLAATASGAAARTASAVRCVRFFASACAQVVARLSCRLQTHEMMHVSSAARHDREAVNLPYRYAQA